MPELILEMWDASKTLHGWQFVDSVIKTNHNVALSALVKEVYNTYKASQGSEEALKQLIQKHTPRQTATQNPAGTLPGTLPASIITPTGPNSGTNQAQPQIIAPERAPERVQDASKLASGRVPDTVQDTSKLASDAVQALFERNRKLRPLKLNHGTPRGLPYGSRNHGPHSGTD